jgi:hypothetical protein
MARGASGSALGSQFDEFLFASVRDDREAPLSVLSALARLDVDPWRMADTLARLPRTAAVQRLALLFADLPDGPADRDSAAARLVAFLPNPAGALSNPPGTSTPIKGEAGVRAASVVLIYIMFMLALLGVQGFALSHQPSPPGTAAQPSAVGKAPAPPRLASAGP